MWARTPWAIRPAAVAESCRARQVLAEQGASHRDVKLENVVWDGEDARLIDFDLALTQVRVPARPWPGC